MTPLREAGIPLDPIYHQHSSSPDIPNITRAPKINKGEKPFHYESQYSTDDKFYLGNLFLPTQLIELLNNHDKSVILLVLEENEDQTTLRYKNLRHNIMDPKI